MKKNKVFLTIMFLVLTNTIFCQDKPTKYQFMVIEYVGPPGKWISVSIDGEKFSLESVVYESWEKETPNANPLLSKVKEYQNKDWEVMNFETQISSGGNEFFFAYLRKKKVD